MQAELGAPDSRNIAAGSTANYYNVKGVSHVDFLVREIRYSARSNRMLRLTEQLANEYQLLICAGCQNACPHLTPGRAGFRPAITVLAGQQ